MALRHSATLLSLIFFAHPIVAQSDRTDFDIDNDGLIEINSLADLEAIHSGVDGKSLYGKSTGCPTSGCIGFELTRTLDFDSNGDSVIDGRDWREGQRWFSLGDSQYPFSAVFDGNGYEIRNLRVKEIYPAGLFGVTENATIKNIGITGRWTHIESTDATAGTLIGDAKNTVVSGIYVSGRVQGRSYSGGIIGSAKDSRIIGAHSSAKVISTQNSVGGIVGYLIGTSDLEGLIVTGSVEGNGTTGGIGGFMINTISMSQALAVPTITSPFLDEVGQTGGGLSGTYSLLPSLVHSNHWATDRTGRQLGHAVYDAYLDYFGPKPFTDVGATLAELQCPSKPSDPLCRAELYQGWTTKNSSTKGYYWQFESGRLPRLVIGGKVIGDADFDRAFDDHDAFPLNPAASLDSDSDGFPDAWNDDCDSACVTTSGLVIDDFPYHAAAAIDNDLDGLPDAWLASCDLTCQIRSELTLDTHLNDVDNDGIPDDMDTDVNGKPLADADGDGLIEIYTLDQLFAIRHNLAGTYFKSSPYATANATGCPYKTILGRLTRVCHGYELASSLNVDSNGNGVIDELDWHQGYWEPIGDRENPFTAIFEGNGFEIRNMKVGVWDYAGLFGVTQGATLSNLGITGRWMSVEGYQGDAGGLIGYAENTSVTGVYVTGSVKGTSSIGGIIGRAINTQIRDVHSGAAVTSSDIYAGGIIGKASDTQIERAVSIGHASGIEGVGGIAGFWWGGQISQVLVVGRVKGNRYVGALVGDLMGAQITQVKNHWESARTGWPLGYGELSSHKPNLGSSATLAELTCPSQPGDSHCRADLYEGWTTKTTNTNGNYWHFEAGFLPRLVINGNMISDRDFDGTLDDDDAYPDNSAASFDTDGDGYHDAWNSGCDHICQTGSDLQLDKFPTNAAAAIDTDDDGYPDEWNQGCNVECQTASGLMIDAFPNHKATAIDTDNDGNPDEWNSECDLLCQQESGLTVVDIKGPLLRRVPDNQKLAADGLYTVVDIFSAQALATDNVDTPSQLRYEVIVNGKSLYDGKQLNLSLISGRHTLDWTAIDRAGNRSNSIRQFIDIYPELAFATTTVMVEFPETASIPFVLYGDSPTYPIKVNVQISYDGTELYVPDDFITIKSPLTFTFNSAEEFNKGAVVVQFNDVGKYRDVSYEKIKFRVEIVSATAGSDDIFSLPIDSLAKNANIKIGRKNVAPELHLTITQNGQIVKSIDMSAGMARLALSVFDINRDDTHTYDWDLLVFGLSNGNQQYIDIDPDQLTVGAYQFSATVTDSGIPSLSDTKNFVLTVTDSNSPLSSSSSSSAASSVLSQTSSQVGVVSSAKPSGGGGGSASLFILLLITSLGFLKQRSITFEKNIF